MARAQGFVRSEAGRLCSRKVCALRLLCLSLPPPAVRRQRRSQAVREVALQETEAGVGGFPQPATPSQAVSLYTSSRRSHKFCALQTPGWSVAESSPVLCPVFLEVEFTRAAS